MKRLLILANWMQGSALSGGDKIFIELVKKWRDKLDITLFLSAEGAKICERQGLGGVKYEIGASDKFSQRGYLRDYFYRTWNSIKYSKCKNLSSGDIIYSSSDFGPDSIPAFIIKLRNPGVLWIAGFFLFSPTPWQRNSPYKGKKWFIGLFYWISQLPIYYLINRFADIVFVTSEPDIPKFINFKRGKENIIVVRGGVDTNPSNKYLNSNNVVPLSNRKYDACFIGRLHYQKGVLELPKIWKLVCNKIPKAQLAIIGTGPLESEIKDEIKRQSLSQNIDILGFKVGEDKCEVFKQSKIVLHPATYDSGGMAAAEAMAWGLPGVGFDLESLKTYYPKGMLKTKCFDNNEFAENIEEMLTNPVTYKKLKDEALDLINTEWEWTARSKIIFDQIFSNPIVLEKS